MSGLVVVSPHLDDGVFGCADLIRAHPGATVVTVFAGGPAVWGEPTDWDAASGFTAGEDAVARRREEDRRALAELEAHPVWLPFWDSQYGASPGADEIGAALGEVLAELAPDTVAIPLGLWHSDHRLTHEAAAPLISRHPRFEWLAYEDAIYRRFPESGLAERPGWLRDRGIAAIPLPTGIPASDAKQRSIACYSSQLRALASGPGWEDALEPERHWALSALDPPR